MWPKMNPTHPLPVVLLVVAATLSSRVLADAAPPPPPPPPTPAPADAKSPPSPCPTTLTVPVKCDCSGCRTTEYGHTKTKRIDCHGCMKLVTETDYSPFCGVCPVSGGFWVTPRKGVEHSYKPPFSQLVTNDGLLFALQVCVGGVKTLFNSTGASTVTSCLKTSASTTTPTPHAVYVA